MNDSESGEVVRIGNDEASELLIALSGRLDTARCGMISDSVIGHIREAGKPVVFDLDRVDFVASAFLRICLIAAQTVGGGQVRLKHANPAIKKVFKIAGLDGYILID